MRVLPRCLLQGFGGCSAVGADPTAASYCSSCLHRTSITSAPSSCSDPSHVYTQAQADADCGELAALLVDGGASQNSLLMQVRAAAPACGTWAWYCSTLSGRDRSKAVPRHGIDLNVLSS